MVGWVKGVGWSDKTILMLNSTNVEVVVELGIIVLYCLNKCFNLVLKLESTESDAMNNNSIDIVTQLIKKDDTRSGVAELVLFPKSVKNTQTDFQQCSVSN